MYDVMIKTFPSGRKVFQISEKPIMTFFVDKLEREEKEKPRVIEFDTSENDTPINKDRSLRRTKQKIYDIAFANDWEYFVTVTFDKEKVDRFNYDDVVKKYSKQLDNLKQREFKDMAYMMVPELHENGAYHFHGLIKGIPSSAFQKAINPHTGKEIRVKNQIIYNCDKFNLGHNTFSRIVDSEKASTYLSKYITKTLVDDLKGKKKYWSSRGLAKPTVEKLYIADEKVKSEIAISLLDSGEVVSTVTKSIKTPEYSNTFQYIVTQPGADPQYIYRVLLTHQTR